jgi:AcrR family transcriptional regulator
MSKTTDNKREMILAAAERVFIRQGYNGVTLKDILDECGISRGGIYLYYSTVDEIFMDVIDRHNAAKLNKIRADAETEISYDRLLDDFFRRQKTRLLHMENSLTLAMSEFFLAHRHSVDKTFFTDQFRNTKNMILQLLSSAPSSMSTDDAGLLAEHIMFLIEGLSTLAVSGDLTEAQIDRQLDFAAGLVRSRLTEENLSE